MPDNSDLGVGGGAVSEQMAEDIRGLSDSAKRVEATRRAAIEANAAQGLKAATTGQGNVPPPVDTQTADYLMAHLDPVGQRNQYMQALSKKIIEMEKAADDVKKSTTGNTAAHDTYRQVAAILKQRLHNMQTEGVMEPLAKTVAAMQQQPAALARPVVAPGPVTFGGGGVR